MGRDKTDLIKTAERRRWILDRCRRGNPTMREVAEDAIDHFGEEQLPEGFDSRYVSKDLSRSMKKLQDSIQERAEHYRTIQIDRLEDLLEQLWPLTRQHTEEVVEDGEVHIVEKPPDVQAIDRALAIIDRLNSFYQVDEAPDFPGGTSDGDTNIFVQVNQELVQDE